MRPYGRHTRHNEDRLGAEERGKAQKWWWREGASVTLRDLLIVALVVDCLVDKTNKQTTKPHGKRIPAEHLHLACEPLTDLPPRLPVEHISAKTLYFFR